MAKIERQYILTLTEDQAEGLKALLSNGVDYATKAALEISDVEYALASAIGWFNAPEFAVKATLATDADA